MNRRDFLSLSIAGAGGAALALTGLSAARLLQSEVSVPCAEVPLQKYGQFTIESDGVLSLNGQRVFQLYGADGGLTFRGVSYRLENGRPQQFEVV